MTSGSKLTTMVRTFEGNLGDFFIPGDERSTWLYRLTIIRDDLRFEMDHLKVVADNPTSADMWSLFYFLRRITLSIADACAVLRHDVPTWFNRRKKEIPQPHRDIVNAAAKAANETWSDLETERNTLGGHIRPQDAPQHPPGDASDAADVAMIDRLVTTHTGWRAKVTIGDDAAEHTCLHDLSNTSLMSIWPEITDDESLRSKHAAYKALIIKGLSNVVPMIDSILWLFWSSNPAITKTDTEVPR